MNKSKFKSVKFKPLDRFLYEENACFWRDVGMYHDIMFEEKFIENNESLFEVEKAEREFEDGAYYKARYRDQSLPEAIKYIFGKFFRTSDVMGSHRHYAETDFHEISEKIEL